MLDSNEYKLMKNEFNYQFAEMFRGLRIEKGLSLEQLSKQTRTNLHKLQSLELGRDKDRGLILKLARFYWKKIKMEFY